MCASSSSSSSPLVCFKGVIMLWVCFLHVPFSLYKITLPCNSNPCFYPFLYVSAFTCFSLSLMIMASPTIYFPKLCFKPRVLGWSPIKTLGAYILLPLAPSVSMSCSFPSTSAWYSTLMIMLLLFRALWWCNYDSESAIMVAFRCLSSPWSQEKGPPVRNELENTQSPERDRDKWLICSCRC